MESGIASSPVSTVSRGQELYTKLMLRLIPLLLLCYLTAYLDRMNVGFAKLQMLADLNLSDTIYGLGAGIFFLGYVIFEVPANLILMHIGPRLWISIIMVAWGAASALTMFVKTPLEFCLLRFLLGSAEAGFIPAILYYLTIWFPSSQRGRASALFLAGIPLSGIVGGPVSGLIMSDLDGSFGLAGWQWMFVLEGVVAIVVGIICGFYLDNDVESAKWLSASEKEQVKGDIAAQLHAGALHSTRDALFSGRVWLLSITYFFFTMGLYGLTFWLPSIIAASGVGDMLTVGCLSALPYVGALAAMYFVGRSSDNLRERRWHLAVPAVAGSTGLVLSVLYAHNTALALGGLTIAAMGILTCIPQFYILPPMILSGSAAAMGLAVANSVGSVAGFVSPYLLGWVKDLTGSTNIGIIILAGALLIGALLVFTNPARLVNR